jgi:FAD/FMN-containing dehydrogenase
MKRFQAIAPEIAGEKQTGEYHVGFLHEWNDLREIYGENYGKLMELKQSYDPRNRFSKGVDLVKGRVTEGATV